MWARTEARLEVEHTSSCDRHDVVAPCEAVRAVPVGIGDAACGLAVAVGEHLVLGEDLDVLCAMMPSRVDRTRRD